jgi:hypothetical protein
MNRATFLTTLAGGAFAFPCLARQETTDERAIYDVLDAAVDAQFTYDFPRLVALLHPASVQMFRDIQSARCDQLMKLFPDDAVLKTMGISSHPKDLSLSDAEFFVAACGRAREIQTDFAGDPKYLPLVLHGSIFEGDSIAYVVYSYSGAVHTNRTDFDYVQPGNMTFRKVAGKWFIYSSFLSYRIANVWWYRLSQAKNSEGIAK